ncbi:hypothetical protein BDY17DRAFT_52136 [Neohortaea acidophila]|uniref:Uncharacterized protein n=1 Tax=Neohortaea acidophila TaxID=245834 RepID=A0A6A6PH22_9PEZI|nr:uncharacterized protein BDY17DRAFT_52136 [Neohortaea acidophila]KAF2479215.1 hypothetical protein BDY17DRAFT_52136 [Neohortaea acidophila]
MTTSILPSPPTTAGRAGWQWENADTQPGQAGYMHLPRRPAASAHACGTAAATTTTTSRVSGMAVMGRKSGARRMRRADLHHHTHRILVVTDSRRRDATWRSWLAVGLVARPVFFSTIQSPISGIPCRCAFVAFCRFAHSFLWSLLHVAVGFGFALALWVASFSPGWVGWNKGTGRIPPEPVKAGFCAKGNDCAGLHSGVHADGEWWVRCRVDASHLLAVTCSACTVCVM